MKTGYYIIAMLCCLLSGRGYSQSVLICDDASSSADTSALLELKSNSLGFLPSRLTLDQINLLSSPQAGMMVYNLTKDVPMYYSGADWLDLTGKVVSTSLEVGDYYQGGVIFYLDGFGGGYIAALSDVEVSGAYNLDWGCMGTETAGTSTIDGESNTASILTACSSVDIAAFACSQYSSGGYSDWFLPALDQLDSIYVHQDEIGDFNSERYWSSSESNSNQANWLHMGSRNTGAANKTNNNRVRPMREF